MATKLSITLVDSRGRTTKKILGMDDQTLLADYVTEVTALLAALEPTTDLGLVRAELIIPVTGLTWSFIADSNKDVGATASGWIDLAEGKKASSKIPGIKMSLVATDGTVAITGVVATYLAEFEAAGGFTLSDGEKIASWIRATLDS